MRIAFVGTVEFSRHCLEQILAGGGNVVGIFTMARKEAGFHSDYAPMSDLAREHGIPLHLVKNINNPKTKDLIKDLKPDVIFVFGWSQIISNDILEIPTIGCIGTHPALLPRNRGRHPIVWALVLGLAESGLTFFYLTNLADSGDILWQKSFSITLRDDAASIYRKIEDLASEAIEEFLPQIENGTAPRIPQDQSKATYWRRRHVKDGEVNWRQSTMTTFNLIRALTQPYVGAHTFINGGKLIIWKSSLPAEPTPCHAISLPPGTVFADPNNQLNVRTGNGHIVIEKYEMADGGKIQIGARLGDLR